MRQRIQRLAAVLAVAAALLGVLPTAAAAAQSVTATMGASCPGGQMITGGKFTLTGVVTPPTVTVNPNVSPQDVQASSFTGGFAYYDVALDAMLDTSRPAIVTVPNDWNDTFAFTAATCATPKAAGLSAQATFCGLAPVILEVKVTNGNSLLVGYTVSASGLGSQHKDVAKNATEEVDFGPITRGRSYTVTAKGEDGTTKSITANVALCNVPAPPATRPATAAPKASRPPTHPPSASVPASPSASASASAEATAEPDEAAVVAVSTTPVADRKIGNPKAPAIFTAAGIAVILIGMTVFGICWLRRDVPSQQTT